MSPRGWLTLCQGSTGTRKDWAKQVWGEGLEHKHIGNGSMFTTKTTQNTLLSKRGGWNSRG